MIAVKAAIWNFSETLGHVDIEAAKREDDIQNLYERVPLIADVVDEAFY